MALQTHGEPRGQTVDAFTHQVPRRGGVRRPLKEFQRLYTGRTARTWLEYALK